jgi:hypothetical protein
MNHPEHDLQKTIHRYLKLAVPQPCCIWAVDHARKATMLQRVRLKERGAYAGIHDHFILYDGQLITLEIKIGNNDTTLGQDIFAENASMAGARCFVVYSLEDVEQALRKCGVPVLATAQARSEKLAEIRSRKAKRPCR